MLHWNIPKNKQQKLVISIVGEETTSKKVWRVVEFHVDEAYTEMAGWLMMQLGANGCEEHPADEPGKVALRATFEQSRFSDEDTGKVISALDEYGLNGCIPSLRVSDLFEEDWLAKWKLGFEPFPIGAGLMVCPIWLKEKMTPDVVGSRKVIYVDPGLAFGTGFHATTRFCLTALQNYVDAATNILDVGAGSGILSIACALLNDSVPIVGVENDPVACKNARENLQLNGMFDRVRLIEGTTDSIKKGSERFDLILANMTYEDHVALLPDYIFLAKSGCRIELAGILKEKSHLMKETFAKYPLEIEIEDVGDMWVGYVVRVQNK